MGARFFSTACVAFAILAIVGILCCLMLIRIALVLIVVFLIAVELLPTLSCKPVLLLCSLQDHVLDGHG